VRLRLPVTVLIACQFCVLVGCAGGGSSGTNPAAAIPAAAHEAAGPAQHGVRRPSSVPTCSTVGGGSFVGGGYFGEASGYAAAVVGGLGNEACDDYSSVVGGESNSIATSNDAAIQSFIGGGYQNVITGGAEYGFLGGGHANTVTGITAALSGGYQNQNAAANAMLGAGQSNTITSAGDDAFLGGGSTNTVSGQYGVIAGGLDNTVSGEGGYIAAGGYNTLSGIGAVIDGGFNNKATGDYATIPGGYVNNAAGTYSFAAGARASAALTGTFVWSDGSDGDTILTATRAYQFLARAWGGYTLWTNAAGTVGATLAPGSGTWASASDRNMKTNIARVDDAAVLDEVVRLPIDRWSYVTERGVRHVGPMAQDFYAAFGVGEDDKHITSIDEDGVALAAIKALHAENADLRARLATVTAAQSAQTAALRRLSAVVAALRKP